MEAALFLLTAFPHVLREANPSHSHTIVLGVAQSGFQQYRLAQLPEHQDLLDKACFYAQKVLNEDSDLKKNENLRILLYLFERQKAIMTLKAG